ncbi:MAG: glutathione S-transferase [Sandaracinaceae bacterium]|nr:glutathione S-transferase [Sandaracinaceae bacterium]
MELWGLSYSPWTEQARWALDHHGLAYKFKAYVPFLREAALRLRMKKFWGRVTVPMMVVDKTVYPDSLDIIRYAEKHGKGATLLPDDLAIEAESWKARADAALSAARGMVLRQMRSNAAGLNESVPGALPGWLRRPLAISGLWLFGQKYRLAATTMNDEEARMVEALDALRAALARSGGKYILGRFTLADISAATMLQAVLPVDGRHWKIGPGMRAGWTNARLAEKYEDLLKWRDAIYNEHRPATTSRRA